MNYPLVGMQFIKAEAKEHVATLSEGAELFLKRNPDNVHDSNAIEVHSGDFMIGHIGARYARQLAPILDESDPDSYPATLVNIIDRKSGTVECDIDVDV